MSEIKIKTEADYLKQQNAVDKRYIQDLELLLMHTRQDLLASRAVAMGAVVVMGVTLYQWLVKSGGSL